jgi:hypothetical protein
MVEIIMSDDIVTKHFDGFTQHCWFFPNHGDDTIYVVDDLEKFREYVRTVKLYLDTEKYEIKKFYRKIDYNERSRLNAFKDVNPPIEKCYCMMVAIDDQIFNEAAHDLQYY